METKPSRATRDTRDVQQDSDQDFQQDMENKIAYGQYQQIAQKLDKHIQDIYEADELEKKRWIWELIQNAKDAPNIFKRLHVRIELLPNEMRFMHNADEFSMDDIVSLVEQFSSKASFNRTQNTTGKYGTGFITTLLISKVIQIQGKLRYTKKKNSGEAFTKEFKILLDREYQDRDKDLVQKVANSIKDLKKIIKSPGAPAQQRQVTDMDTIFTYKNLDQQAWVYIQNGIDDFMRSCQYVMLFNPSIHQVEIIDKRQPGPQKITTVQREKETRIDGIRIFRASITKKSGATSTTPSGVSSSNNNWVQMMKKTLSSGSKKQTNTTSAGGELQCTAYTEVDANTFLAVPVKLSEDGKQATIVKMSKDEPRIFKEFPLIGTENWGYNYVLTSRTFFPNERRSGLRLKLIETRPDQQVVSNRQKLLLCDQKIEEFFGQIIEAQFGSLQLLATSNPHYDESDKFQIQRLKKFRKFIVSQPLVKLTQGAYEMIPACIYPEYTRNFTPGTPEETKSELCKRYSYQMMRLFGFMTGQAVEMQCYQNLYEILRSLKEQWPNIKMYKIRDYLQALTRLKFDGMKSSFHSELEAVAHLNEIYKFLSQHYTDYVVQPKMIDPNEPSPSYGLNIILNQAGQFSNIHDIYEEERLAPITKRVSVKVRMDIRAFIIDSRISDHIVIEKKFDKRLFEKKLKDRFKVSQLNEPLDEASLAKLFYVVSIFTKNFAPRNNTKFKVNDLPTEAFRRKLHQCYSKLEILSMEREELADQPLGVDYTEFVKKLIMNVYLHISKAIIKDKYLGDLENLLCVKGEAETIKWFNQAAQIHAIAQLGIFPNSVNRNKVFKPVGELIYVGVIDNKFQEEDLKFYNTEQEYRIAQVRRANFFIVPLPQKSGQVLLHQDIEVNEFTRFSQQSFQAFMKPNVLQFVARENATSNGNFVKKEEVTFIVDFVTKLVKREKEYEKADNEEVTERQRQILREKLRIYEPIIEKRFEYCCKLRKPNKELKDAITDIVYHRKENDATQYLLDKYSSLQGVVKAISDLQAKNRELQNRLKQYQQ